MKKVFISYDRNDKSEMSKISKWLAKNFPSITFWVDKYSIRGGTQWEKEISKAIRESQAFVAILTQRSARNRGFFKRELELANAKALLYPDDGFFILPLRVEKCRRKELDQYQRIDLFPNRRQGYNKLKIVFEEGRRYLNRIERARRIVAELRKAKKLVKTRNKRLRIRIRAAFTSLTNIEHYKDKNIPGLLKNQAEQLDRFLIEEREELKALANMRNTELCCICHPRAYYLKDLYYTDNEKTERLQLYREIVDKSKKKRTNNWHILEDEAGAYGNQLFIGTRIAFVARPMSGGYKETIVIEDTDILKYMVREYDKMFKRIGH